MVPGEFHQSWKHKVNLAGATHLLEKNITALAPDKVYCSDITMRYRYAFHIFLRHEEQAIGD
jgi:hypothetical protein